MELKRNKKKVEDPYMDPEELRKANEKFDKQFPQWKEEYFRNTTFKPIGKKYGN